MLKNRKIKKTSINQDFALKRFESDVDIFSQFQPGKEAFIIKSGTVELYKTSLDGVNEKENILGKLGEGALFGEMALIDDKPRMASARAINGPVVLKVITKEQFYNSLGDVNPFVSKLLSILVEQVRENTR